MKPHSKHRATVGILVLTAGMTVGVPQASGRTWWVDPTGGPADFERIVDALAVAADGDVVRLADGKYTLPGGLTDKIVVPEAVRMIGNTGDPDLVQIHMSADFYSTPALEILGGLAGVTILADPNAGCVSVVGMMAVGRCVAAPDMARDVMGVRAGVVVAVDFLGTFGHDPVASEGGEVRHCRFLGTTSLSNLGFTGVVFANNIIHGSAQLSVYAPASLPGWAMIHSGPYFYEDDHIINNTIVLSGLPGEEGVAVAASYYPWWYPEFESFVNNIVAFNHVGGVKSDTNVANEYGFDAIHHNDVYANAGCNYCVSDDVTETPFPGGPHYSQDPHFVALSDDGDFSNDDLHLQPGSPMIDAGDPTILDPDGSVSDVGAYGGPDADLDGDRLGPLTGDCDEGDPAVHAFAPEQLNGRDDDCDGVVDEDTEASDDDGDGFSEDQGDCSDRLASIHPGAEEVPGNGWDDDCDGSVDEVEGGDDDTASDDDSAAPDDDTAPDDDSAPGDDDSSAGTDGPEAPDTTCGGCTTATGAPSPALPLLAALLLARRRRPPLPTGSPA